MEKKMIAIIAVIAVAIVAIAAAAVAMGGGEKSKDYVYYDGNGGTLGGQTTYQSTSTVCEENDLFTREGYICTGYNTKANGTGTAYSEGANVMLGTKLYAQWKVDDESYLTVGTQNHHPDKYNLYLGSSQASSVNIDGGGIVASYPLKAGDKIYVQVAGSSGTVGVDKAKERVSINVGDGNTYLLTFSFSGVTNLDYTASGMMAVISFDFPQGQDVHVSYIQAVVGE